MSSSYSRRGFLKVTAAASAGLALQACSGVRPMQAPAYRKAGPLVMIDMIGTTLPPETAALIEQHHLRAVILFQRNVESLDQARRLVGDLRSRLGRKALIGIDQEGGSVIRVRDLPVAPSPMALGAVRDPGLAYQVGAAVGRGLASLGINWNFAPSLDVNNNPLNPVIGDRSYGSDPRLVADLGLAWARGCEASGVAACVKHFPGHGDTAVDSHYGLPVVDKPLQRLRDLELLPFRAAAEAPLAAFMTSHIVYPALDATYPATLSPAILTRMLRDEWGYDGVVITDSMSMQAIADQYGRGDAALRALDAGADMVMALGHGDAEAQLQTLEAVEQAFDGKHLSRRQRDRKMRHLDALAGRFPSTFAPYGSAQQAADDALFRDAWRRALTAYRQPTRPAPGSRVVLLAPQATAGGGASDRGLSGVALAEHLRPLYDLDVVFYDEKAPQAALPALRTARQAGGPVLLATAGRHRPSDAFRTLIDAAEPTLHLALWNPYAVLDVPAPALITYGFRPAALEAAADWLGGRFDAAGTLPIDLGMAG